MFLIVLQMDSVPPASVDVGSNKNVQNNQNNEMNARNELTDANLQAKILGFNTGNINAIDAQSGLGPSQLDSPFLDTLFPPATPNPSTNRNFDNNLLPGGPAMFPDFRTVQGTANSLDVRNSTINSNTLFEPNVFMDNTIRRVINDRDKSNFRDANSVTGRNTVNTVGDVRGNPFTVGDARGNPFNGPDIGDPGDVFGNINIPLDFQFRRGNNVPGTPNPRLLPSRNDLGIIGDPFRLGNNDLGIDLERLRSDAAPQTPPLPALPVTTPQQPIASSLDRRNQQNDNNMPVFSGNFSPSLRLNFNPNQAFDPLNNRGLNVNTRMTSGFPPNTNLGTGGNVDTETTSRGSDTLSSANNGQATVFDLANRNRLFPRGPRPRNFPPPNIRQVIGNIPRTPSSIFPNVNQPRSAQPFLQRNPFGFNSNAGTNAIQPSNLRRTLDSRLLSDVNARSTATRNNLFSLNRNRQNLGIANVLSSNSRALGNSGRREFNNVVNRRFIDSLDNPGNFRTFNGLGQLGQTTRSAGNRVLPMDVARSFIANRRNFERQNRRMQTNTLPVTTNRALFASIAGFPATFSRGSAFRGRSTMRRGGSRPFANSGNRQVQSMPVEQFNTMFNNRINGDSGTNIRGRPLTRDLLQRIRQRDIRRGNSVLQEPATVTPTIRPSSSLDPSISSRGAVQNARALFALQNGASNVRNRQSAAFPNLLLAGLNQVPQAATFLNPLLDFQDRQNVQRTSRISPPDLGSVRERNSFLPSSGFDIPGRSFPPRITDRLLPLIPIDPSVSSFISPFLSDVTVKRVSKEKIKPVSKSEAINLINKRTEHLKLGNKQIANVPVQKTRRKSKIRRVDTNKTI